MVAITQLVPLFYLASLYGVRSKLNPKIAGSEQARLKHRQRLESEKELKPVKFLFTHYSPSWWFFEVPLLTCIVSPLTRSLLSCSRTSPA